MLQKKKKKKRKAFEDITDILKGKMPLNVSKSNIKQYVGSHSLKGRIISKVLNTLKIRALNYKNSYHRTTYVYISNLLKLTSSNKIILVPEIEYSEVAGFELHL